MSSLAALRVADAASAKPASFPLAITGAGRAALLGRLLFETGRISEERLEAIRERSYKRGSTFAWADLGADLPIAFEISLRVYLADDASAATLLLIDATGDIDAALRDQASALRRRGSSQLVVAITGMEAVGYDFFAFATLERAVTEAFAGGGLKLLGVIPISVRDGANLAAPATEMPWYRGPHLLQALDCAAAAAIAGQEVSSDGKILTFAAMESDRTLSPAHLAR